MSNILRYAIGWFGLVVLAILNGALRTKGYQEFMDELTAHQLSTGVGICIFGIYTWILTGIWTIGSSREALAIGCMWLLFTIAFEFLFGRYVMGQPWSRLLQDYNVLQGRLWILVPLWMAIAPYVFYRLRS